MRYNINESDLFKAFAIYEGFCFFCLSTKFNYELSKLIKFTLTFINSYRNCPIYWHRYVIYVFVCNFSLPVEIVQTWWFWRVERPQQVAHKTPRVIALERAQSIHIYFTFAEVFSFLFEICRLFTCFIYNNYVILFEPF